MGYPVISDSEDTPEVRPTGVTTYEALVRETNYEELVPVCIETRGVKVKVEEIDIPVAFAAAFEGERVRREDLQVEFGGKRSHAIEYLHMAEMDDITDGDIQVIGDDLDAIDEGGAANLGIEVLVAGRQMQEDFEGILERQIHRYVNHATGIMHIAQRQLVWLRISKTAFGQGFRLKHIGNILHAKLHDEYGTIVDKVAVRLYTKQEEIDSLLERAVAAFAVRDAKLSGMKDEDVDVFYSCTLCQTFAPNHVCVVSPERSGLCGAYDWLDCKAAKQISPQGCNQPIAKGKTLNDGMGEWDGVNQFVYDHSNRTVEHYCQYLADDQPHDLLRVLRVHRLHRAGGERGDGGQPRARGHDADRDGVQHAGRPGGRRRADAGLPRHRPALRAEREVHQLRRRPAAPGLDAQRPEGRDEGGTDGPGHRPRHARPGRQDCRRDRGHGRQRAARLPDEGRAPGADHAVPYLRTGAAHAPSATALQEAL